jgi:hypothetical protein
MSNEPKAAEKIDAEPEPVWIRDIQARNFTLAIDSPDQIAEICEGQSIHCELCGAGFPLWPPKHWGSHWITVHVADITLQQHTGSAMLCATAFNEAQRVYFQNQFLTRTALRRRAHELGLVKFPEGLLLVPGKSN